MYSSLDNLEYNLYAYPESAPQYIKPEPTMINSIEFMDLTVPQNDNRRRRRSAAAQDKEAVSNMRIVSNPLSLSLLSPGCVPPFPLVRAPTLMGTQRKADFFSAPTSSKPRLATRLP